MAKEVEFIVFPEEARIESESDLRFLIGDKASSVSGQIFYYPFRGRGVATEELADELEELENLIAIWKVNFGRKPYKKKLKEVV